MQKTKFTGLLSLLVCAVLIAATALLTSSCDKSPQPAPPTCEYEAVSTDVTKLGEGSTQFNFTVTDGDGKETAFQISTDEKNVGAALEKLGLIEGEEGAYGLYVKKVNGILADYDVTGTYWAFYIDGEMALSGVDTTEITAGASYSFVVSK